MTSRDEQTVVVDQSDLTRGRFDPGRARGPRSPSDLEEIPRVSPEDIQATRDELRHLKRRMTRKSA